MDKYFVEVCDECGTVHDESEDFDFVVNNENEED